MPQKLGWFLLAAALATCGVALADEEAKVEYGRLRGRFIYDGEPPKQKLLTISGSDKDELEKLMLVDESLVVKDENRGLANVVVYLQVAKDEVLPEMHPSYRIAPDTPDEKRTRTMSMFDTRYIPHVLLVRTDEIYQSVSDTVRGYNPKLDLTANHNSCALQAPGATQTHEFRHCERLPVRLSDNIYPWMRAWVVIQDHPYMAVTDADGRFEIRHIPVGQRTLRMWHEKSGFVSHVKIDDREVMWATGLVTLEIPAGEAIDLGEVKVPAAELD